MSTGNIQTCSLWRRLAAVFYDALLLFSILFFATFVFLPVTGGQAFSGNSHFYHAYLYGCCYLYFTWQWVHGGRTLGMMAWHIRVVTMDNRRLDWKQASVRFLLACLSWLLLGAGFFWVFFDRDKLAFHDRFSGTRLSRIN